MPSPREEMLVCIEELVDLHSLNLHSCVTSRSQADITATLNRLPSRQVSLYDEKQDIVSYVNPVVYTDPEMRKWRATDKDLVIVFLTRRVDGM